MIEIDMKTASTLTDIAHTLAERGCKHAVAVELEPCHLLASNEDRYTDGLLVPVTIWVDTDYLLKNNVVSIGVSLKGSL
jgi:hypothetical protein